MKKIHIPKRFVVFLLIIAIFLISGCTGASRNTETGTEAAQVSETGDQSSGESTIAGSSSLPEGHWFQPTDLMLSSWNVGLDGGNDDIVLLSPTVQPSDGLQKIFFLYTKPNIAFDESVSQVMSVFQSRGIPIQVAVYLALLGDEVNGDQAGLDGLSYAEANDYDLVYSMGSSTTAFLHDNYQGGALPVVAILSKDPVLRGQMPDYEQGSGTNIVYTSVSVPTAVQMNYFTALVPGLENVVVLYEQNNTSAVDVEVTPLDAYAADTGINVTHVAVENPEQASVELQDSLTTVMEDLRVKDPEKNKSIILITNSASIVDSFEIVNQIAGDFPVVGLRPALVQEGVSSAVLAVGVDFNSNSLLAALYGVRVLIDGENPGEMPVGVITPPDMAINFAKARELGLKIPFGFFESATIIFGPEGDLIREKGQ